MASPQHDDDENLAFMSRDDMVAAPVPTHDMPAGDMGSVSALLEL